MALREVFGRLAFDFPGAEKLPQHNAGMTKLKQGIEAVAAVLAGSAIIGGIKQFAEQLDVLDDLHAQTGIATDDLQTLGLAYELAGGSAQEMNAALTLLQKSLGRTADASGPQAEALKKLGVDTTKGPKKLAEVLPLIFGGFGKLKNEVEEAEVATAIFGRQGVRLLPTLRKGAAGLEEVRAQLDEFGGPVGEDAIETAGKFRDNMALMDRALFALKGRFANAVFPQLSKVITAFGKGVGKLADWVKNTTLADTAMKALAVTAGAKLATALAPYLGPGLKFAGIFLAVDDLLGFLEGKDSLIGRLLTRAFGEEATGNIRRFALSVADMVKGIASFAADNLGFLITDLANGFPALGEAFSRVVLDMKQTWLRFVLKAIVTWNKLAPKKLQIDTKEVLDDLVAVQDAINNIGFKKPLDPATVPVEQGGADVGPEFGRRVDVNGNPIRPKFMAPEFAPVREKIDRLFGVAPGFAPAAAGPAAAFFEPRGGTTTVNQGPVNVTVNLPPGTSPQAARTTVANAIVGGARDAGAQRVSRQALVQRK